MSPSSASASPTPSPTLPDPAPTNSPYASCLVAAPPTPPSPSLGLGTPTRFLARLSNDVFGTLFCARLSAIVAIAMSQQAAPMSAPAMTTVSADEREMGRLGVELLISRLEGESGPRTQKLFQGTLHATGTSGPARSRTV